MFGSPILFVLIIGWLIHYKQQCNKLACISFNGLTDYKETEIYQNTNNTYRALLEKSDSTLLRAEIISNIEESEAQEEINARVIRVKAFSEKSPAPYPGEISDSVICSDNFIPKYQKLTINGINLHTFSGFYNDRLVFGACTEETIENPGMMILFYCVKSKQLYQLELVKTELSDNNSEQLIDIIFSLSCNQK